MRVGLDPDGGSHHRQCYKAICLDEYRSDPRLVVTGFVCPSSGGSDPLLDFIIIILLIRFLPPPPFSPPPRPLSSLSGGFRPQSNSSLSADTTRGY